MFLRHLAAKLPRRKSGPAYQFDDEVRLEYYRLQKISEGSISLQDGEARRLDGPTEVGSGLVRPQPVPLSQLIDVVNERFGTDFNQADQLFFDQIVEAAMADDGLAAGGRREPGRQVRAGVQEPAGEALRRAHGSERRDLRAVHERRAIPEDRDGVDGVGGVPAAAKRCSVKRTRRDRSRAAAAAAASSRPDPKERYVTCVPLVPLKAAAGAFGDPQHIEDDGFEWVAVESAPSPAPRHVRRPGRRQVHGARHP